MARAQSSGTDRHEGKGSTRKLRETLGPARKGRGQADNESLWHLCVRHKGVIWQSPQFLALGG